MSRTDYELLEAGKLVGWNIEPTPVVLMGESCPCKCKWIATFRGREFAHFRSATAAKDAIRQEQQLQVFNPIPKYLGGSRHEID